MQWIRHRSRIVVLERLLEHMASSDGVWFARHDALARHVQPLVTARGRPARPDQTRVGAISTLGSMTAYSRSTTRFAITTNPEVIRAMP